MLFCFFNCTANPPQRLYEYRIRSEGAKLQKKYIVQIGGRMILKMGNAVTVTSELGNETETNKI